jgi:hypothetical protein
MTTQDYHIYTYFPRAPPRYAAVNVPLRDEVGGVIHEKNRNSQPRIPSG